MLQQRCRAVHLSPNTSWQRQPPSARLASVGRTLRPRLISTGRGAYDRQQRRLTCLGKGPRHDEGREIRHLRVVARHGLRMVRLLSLRNAGAVLRGTVLPARKRHRGAAVGLRDLRRRLPGAPFRRAPLRPHRRSRRPQIHLPRHHPGDGRLDLRSSACCRPTRPIGWLAPDPAGDAAALLQGLALGGEYGGAATYVAEHSRRGERGYATSCIQTTATLGFFLALLVIGLCRIYMDAKTFAEWGWRIPFLISLFLLGLLGLDPAQARTNRRSSRR